METQGLDNITEFLEQKNYNIANHYEKRYEKAKEKVSEFWQIAYRKESFKIEEYESTIRDIKKWRNKFLIEKLEKNNQAFGAFDSHTMNLIDYNFNEFKDFISVAITTLQTLEEQINFRLSKLQENKAELQTIDKVKKQPTAKILMAFIRQIEEQTEIVPKPNEYGDNDEKFRIIAKRIKERFEYEFSGKTLEKEDYKQEGYSISVFNLLKEWKYNAIATKYNAIYNK